MRLALLGATSTTGRHVIAAALREGHEVRALVRPARPGSGVRNLPLRDGLFQVAGDAMDLEVLLELTAGCDAAISLVGPVRESVADLSSRSAETLVRAAAQRGLGQLVLVTGAMIGHPVEHAHGLYRVAPPFLGSVREDRRRAEQIVAASPTPWTIVRPPRLGDGPTEGWVSVGPSIEVGTMDFLPRIDLAEVLVEAAASGRWTGQAVAARTAHDDERPWALKVPLTRQLGPSVRLRSGEPRDSISEL
jgi:uncharacterized protein YbjT (DUF2867 family)